MYISVIPFSHTISLEPFTYFVHSDWQEQIQVGCLVEIPFGNNIEQGIVSEILDGVPVSTDIEALRPVISVIASIPLLEEYQISMIFAISRQYFMPLHKVLRIFLPAPLLSRLDKKNYIIEMNTDIANHSETRRKYQIHHYSNHAFSASDIGKYFQSGSVFLFPDDFFLLSLVGTEISPSAQILTDSTPVHKAKLWMSMYGGKEKIIVGTRRLLYYNLAQYQQIYYIEDAFGDEDYQYPNRIRNLDILRILADQGQFHITIITSSPTLELFAKFRDFQISPQ